MKITQNPEIVREILDKITEEYVEERDFPHVTQLIYCLTKSYFDITGNTKPTDEELLLFAVGWGLERVLLETQAEAGEKNGVYYSPDFITLRGQKAELKTTRMSSKKTEGPDYELPEGWIKQMMAYCYVNGSSKYTLVVYHLVGEWRPPDPKLAGLDIEFDDQELEGNWQEILARKRVLEECISMNQVPTPFQWRLADWECKNCRYHLVCQVMKDKEDLYGPR